VWSAASSYYFANLRVDPGQTLGVIAVKLELGSEQTLAHNEGTEESPVWVLNEIPDYGEELAKCQRYYQRISFGANAIQVLGSGVTLDANAACIILNLVEPMADIKTFNYDFGSQFMCRDNSGNVINLSNIRKLRQGSITYSFAANTNYEQRNVPIILLGYDTTDGYFEFSAEP
jgi:hypothetical protein